MKLPRWVHRAYAAAAGYFWLPCPVCGRSFGGHEWRDHDGLPSSIPTGPATVDTHDYDDEVIVVRRHESIGICPACTRAGHGREPVITVTSPLGTSTSELRRSA